MSAPSLAKKPKRVPLPIAVIVSLFAGLGTGMLLRSQSDEPWVSAAVDMFDVIGTMWLNAIRMTVIPIIVPLLIGAVAGASSGKSMGRMGLAAAAWIVGLLAIAAVGSALVMPLVFGHLQINASDTDVLRATAAATSIPAGDASLATWLKALIPTNPVKAASDGALLSLIVFALSFGFAALAAPANVRQSVIRGTDVLTKIMFIVIQGVLWLAPLGVFALTLVVGVRLGVAVIGALGYYILAIVLMMAAATALPFVAAVMFGRLSSKQFLSGALPAVLVAAGTSSSLSALPAMIEGARDTWRQKEEIYGLVLPLAVSTFKFSCAVSFVVNAAFVGILYGTPLSPELLMLVAGYAVLINATIPGIPGGSMIAITPIFSAVGLPIEGIAILFAVNPIVDRFSTMSNVTADMALTAVLARFRTGGAGDVGAPGEAET